VKQSSEVTGYFSAQRHGEHRVSQRRNEPHFHLILTIEQPK